MYIAFEGVVGVGKSTQSKRLVERLQKKFPDREVVRVREPGSTQIAEAIRTLVQAQNFEEDMLPITDVYLYASARAQLVNGKVKQTLAGGGIVVSDRTFVTSLAYQGHAQGFGIDRVWEVNKIAVENVLPDHILFLDLDVAEGHKRTFDANGDKRERKSVEFFETIHEGYQIVKGSEQLKDVWHDIDATGSVEDVEERIQKLVDSILI